MPRSMVCSPLSAQAAPTVYKEPASGTSHLRLLLKATSFPDHNHCATCPPRHRSSSLVLPVCSSDSWIYKPLLTTPSRTTGYIGGSVLARLLDHPNANTFEITAIVRSPEKAQKLEKFGVKAVVGSMTDLPLVEKLTEAAHIVFSCVCRGLCVPLA